MMSTLAAQIHSELERDERYTIYEFELARIWSLDERDRESKIAQFAEKKRTPSPILPRGMVRRLRQAPLKSPPNVYAFARFAG